MDDFDRIELDRERNEGLVYEEWWDAAVDRAAEDDDFDPRDDAWIEAKP